MKVKLKTIFFCSLFFLLFFSPAHAWVEPTTVPPGNNILAPINSSAFGQSKVGGLILNLGNAAHGLIVRYGLVGIGTDNPESKLDVIGETRTDSLSVRGNSSVAGNETVGGSISSTGNIATSNSLCIKGDCKSAWPTTASTSVDTLQTVTDRGSTTNKSIQTPVLYDQNNTGYYLDPNGWSNLELTNINNHLCIRGDCRPTWSEPRRHCFWMRLETHWMAACPDGYHVDGMALTNASAGCWEAGCQGGQSSWVTAGGFLCCND